MKYRTTQAMYLPDDRFVDAGVEIGDDTPFPLPEGYRPSRTLEALDEDAEGMLEGVKEGGAQDNEDGIAAKLERENRDLRQKLAQMQAESSTQLLGGTEPWAPRTDTGPSQHQGNVGKNPDGSDMLSSHTAEHDQDGRLILPRQETPRGASSTTPPRDSIQLPATEEAPRPVPRVRSSILDDKGVAPPAKPTQSSEVPVEERDGPQTGVDDPSPMNNPATPSPFKVEIKSPEGERPGDQSVDSPNNDLDLKDTEEFMPNNEPNAPGAPGPLGAKNQKKK